MHNIDSVVQRYIDAWNETEPVRRRAVVAEVFAEDALYTDPLASVRGHAEIDQLIGAAQAQFGGFIFGLAGPVDAHHNQARFTWQLSAPNSQDPLVVGFDVAVLDNGRIRAVYGFLDKVPAGAA
jgi:SnoaL-like domain